MLNYMLENKEE